MLKEVISTNLKRYEQINSDTYKLLVSYYYSGSKVEREELGEKSFIPAVEKMLGDNVKVIEGTLVDYTAIPGNYKTCLVKAAKKVMQVSAASLDSMVSKAGFQTIAANIFVDPATNSIWKKIKTDSGIIQLVQEQKENLEEMMRQYLDVSEVVAASARPLYALGADKFDYVLFYNPEFQRVEAGIAVDTDGAEKVVVSRAQRKLTNVNPQCLITVASVSELINQFQKDLKGAKGSKDVMEAYISFWFNSLEGKEASNYIESELKKNVLKSTASLEALSEAEELVEDIKSDLEAKESELLSAPSKEEVEAIMTTKFDQERVSNFAFVEDAGEKAFTLKFTKPMSIDDVAYVLATIKDVFKVEPSMATTAEFVNITIAF